MDSSFYRNRYLYPQPDPSRYPHSHSPAVRPKVVQIPVHFLSSEPVDRAGAALKIQKVVRGFLVRKSMKKIKVVKKQVDEIEEKLSSGEVVELIRRDQKERLRLSEGLMSLLLKLDSIRGLDLGVRDCRKAVIRKAIALQEKIDAITSADVVKTCDQELNVCGKTEDCDDILDISDKGSVEETDGEVEIIDVGVDSEMKVTESEKCDKHWEGGCENYDDNKRNRELLEKMMEENGKMMNMMSELFHSNENQMKMLSALTHRVELLEQAFLCDKLRRKKNKKNNKNNKNKNKSATEE